MVEYTSNLNIIFYCLADETRRDILSRIANGSLTVSQIAAAYGISLAAVSKHLKVLEKAKLIIKSKKGKERHVSIAPLALKDANEFLNQYEALWLDKFNRIDELVS